MNLKAFAQNEEAGASDDGLPRASGLIFGEGEMADLTRAYDWSTTGLGPFDQWPKTLLTTVNILLASRHPMFLWWGPELIQFYNDAYRRCIGADKHPRALGQRGPECWPEIWPLIGPEIDAALRDGQSNWHENSLVPIYRDGTLQDVYWTYSYSPVRDPDGEIRGTLVVCTDTTASVLAREQLRRERERFAAVFQQAPAFFVTLGGPDHVFEMANARYMELVGHRPILGRPVRDAIPEAVSQGFIELLDEVYRTGLSYIGNSTPLRLSREPGKPLELRYVDFVYEPRRESDGSVSGIIVLGVDVTSRKQAEEALLQSEKLAIVGRLASSIAHEINNPLAAVTNLLFLARASAVNANTQQHLDEAEVQLRRVAAITGQTLRFHRQSSARIATSLDRLTDEGLALFQARVLNSGVVLERRDRPQPPITCLDGEIRQLIGNLVANALDAMALHGGRLFVRTQRGTNWKNERLGARLMIADTGSGISPEILPRLFEPFFTTKGANGTGLGLWITQEIVLRHGGTIRVRSSPGRLTVFLVWLPSDQGSAPPADPLRGTDRRAGEHQAGDSTSVPAGFPKAGIPEGSE